MSNPNESLFDLAVQAGPPPEGVDLPTWLIASVPSSTLTPAAQRTFPSYEQLEQDRDQGGNLLEFISEVPQPEGALGHEVVQRQHALSRPSRLLATVACSLAFFSAAETFGYKAVVDSDKRASAMLVDGTHTIKPSTSDQIGRASLIGVPGALAGGTLAYFIAFGFSGRLARRPAQKRIQKTHSSAN